MSVKNLKNLFQPNSVAVIGAEEGREEIGAIVMQNLLAGGFAGPVMPVSRAHRAVRGVLAYPDVAALPTAPDLAIIIAPPTDVMTTVTALGDKGTRAALLVGDSLDRDRDARGRSLQDAVVAEARRFGMRLLGPNGIGLLVPPIGLNASFAARPARPGKIAFVSQSKALCNAVLDWAESHNIGFSHFVSVGAAADVDFGDVLDYLASDPDTTAIMLYIESIRDARKFMSAARAASRNKPVLAIKAGRSRHGAQAALSHTGNLAGVDHVYDTALRRAGILRVHDFDELFEAVRTLGHATTSARAARGERLAIVTNAGSIGVLATDALADAGGHMAELAPATLAKLDAFLKQGWSRGNPVDIGGHAPAPIYAQTLQALLAADEVDAVLAMHAPTATVGAADIAKAIADVARTHKGKTVSTCFVGEGCVAAARQLFDEAHIPSHPTPEQAVRALMHMIEYRRNQEILMQTPTSMPKVFRPDVEQVRTIVRAALSRGQSMLDEHQAKTILGIYGVPVIASRIAGRAEDAARVAGEIGYPVALKILSDDIAHKSGIGGVRLDLKNADELTAAAREMVERVSAALPTARIRGFSVQPMVRRTGSHELILGVADDEVFGPVILFGEGGTAVEVIQDHAVALPPLNMALAKDLIGQTRIARLLHGHGERPAADRGAIAATLCRVSQLVCDIPELRELDINPLVVDAQGVIALDARIKIAPLSERRPRLAIRPYPTELEEKLVLSDGRTALLRPIRPEDEPAHHEFHARLSPDDIRLRHFAFVKEIVHSQMARLTQIDYDREMAFIATCEGETLGVVRVALDGDMSSAEFSIIIRSDLKGCGLGSALFEKMLRYCETRGVRTITGQTMRENRKMQELAQRFGFALRPDADGLVEMTKIYLAAAAAE